MDFKEIIEQLKDSDPKEFAEALHSDAADHYQFIFNGGHKTAKSEATRKLNEVKRELEEANEARAKVEESLQKLREERGDEGEWQARMEKALLAKDEEFRLKEEKYGEREKDLLGRLRNSTLDRLRSDTIRVMVSEHGVDRDMAEVKVLHPNFERRLRVSDEGTVDGAYQKDFETPMPVPNGQKVHSLLARELAESVDPKFRTDPRPTGANIGQRGGSAKRMWKESEIAKLSDADLRKAMPEIQQAMDEGRVIPD